MAGTDWNPDLPRAILDTTRVTDAASFHDECGRAFGFPAFYGRNMDAWIDCLASLREGGGMTRFHLAPGERLEVEVRGAEELNRRAPGIVTALVECSATANQRYVASGGEPALALVFV